jgi:hypothetical protein
MAMQRPMNFHTSPLGEAPFNAELMTPSRAVEPRPARMPATLAITILERDLLTSRDHSKNA